MKKMERDKKIKMGNDNHIMKKIIIKNGKSEL